MSHFIPRMFLQNCTIQNADNIKHSLRAFLYIIFLRIQKGPQLLSNIMGTISWLFVLLLSSMQFVWYGRFTTIHIYQNEFVWCGGRNKKRSPKCLPLHIQGWKPEGYFKKRDRGSLEMLWVVLRYVAGLWEAQHVGAEAKIKKACAV